MSGPARVTLGAALLSVTWVVVYWLTPPAAERGGVRVEPSVYVGGGTGSGAGDGGGDVIVDPLVASVEMGAMDRMGAGTDPVLMRGVGALDGDGVVADPPGLDGVFGDVADGEESVAVVPPSFTWHTVEAGEHAWSLSERFFGERRWAGAIMRMNPDLDFYRLRAGDRIKVPVDPRNVQGLMADGGALPADGGVEETTYAVREGDTLGVIANRIYGTSRLWTLIRDANSEINRAGTNIRPGQVLVVPLPPAQE